MESLFFDKNLIFETEPDYCNFRTFMDNITFAASVYNITFWVTDHYQKEMYLYSPDPDFQSVFGKMEKPVAVGGLIDRFINPDEHPLTKAMLQTAFQIMRSDFPAKNDMYYMSFNVPYHNPPGNNPTIRLTLFPLLFQETAPLRPWLTYCCIEPGNGPVGNFRYKDMKSSECFSVYIHDKENTFDRPQHGPENKIPPENDSITKEYRFDMLTGNDIEILRLSGLGLTEAEIAENLGTSTSNIKRTKSDMYHLLKIKSTPQAILKLQNQGII